MREPLQRNNEGEGSLKCFVYDLDKVALDKRWTLNSADKIEEHMEEFLQTPVPGSGKGSTVESTYSNLLGWDGEKLLFAGIAIEASNLTENGRTSEAYTRQNYESYLELASKINDLAAEQCGEVQMTDLAGKFVFMNNQAIYRTSAVQGALIGWYPFCRTLFVNFAWQWQTI